MPSFVKTDPEQLLDDMQQTFVKAVPGYNATWSPINTMYLLLIHCGMRHTDFLLERAVVYRQKLNGKQLVPYARNLLRLVLQIVAKKDYLCDFQVDIISIVSQSQQWWALTTTNTREACFLRRTERRPLGHRTFKAGELVR